MTSDSEKPKKTGKKVRVPFRRNRAEPPRDSDWTRKAREADNYEVDSESSESVVAKGKLSRQRTIIVRDIDDHGADSRRGRVIATRGLYAEVDDGEQVWPCTIRRVLRTRQIEERNAVTVGDKVRFVVDARDGATPKEGVIVEVEPRKGELKRRSGRRTHTMVANVDQAIIVSSARQPLPRPHLIDRYIVAAHSGEITPVVCMNKIDLAEDDLSATILDRYARLGYRALATSAVTGEGIEDLRNILKDKESVVAGQSGVGKSSLLNAIQPGLGLKVGEVAEQSEKGRHTTTTATLIRLEAGGYVVDTPGIRAFDLTLVPAGELEAYFVEFIGHVADCKFPDCTHTHETACAIKTAVEQGEIDLERYESYLHIFEDPGAPI